MFHRWDESETRIWNMTLVICIDKNKNNACGDVKGVLSGDISGHVFVQRQCCTVGWEPKIFAINVRLDSMKKQKVWYGKLLLLFNKEK